MSHIQTITLWNISFENPVAYFPTDVQKFWPFQNAKLNKSPPRCLKKDPFWFFKLDDKNLWWRHEMQVLDRIKIMH